MSRQNKKASISISSGVDGLPPQMQRLAQQLQDKHKECWRPERNSLFPCCVVESDPTSIQSMMCLRMLTLDREKYIGWIVWYTSKMKEQDHLLTLASAAKQLVEFKPNEHKDQEEKQA